MVCHTAFGQAILSSNRKEIWAFWNQEKTFTNPTVKFYTMNAFLNKPTFEGETETSVRNSSVYYDMGLWISSYETVQKDFDNHPFFIRSPLTGPETTYQAISVLLNDPEFKRFFTGSGNYQDDFMKRLEVFQDFANKSYRR